MMSDRLYLYEVASEDAWFTEAQPSASSNAQLACAVARWAGLPADSENTRWLRLPGDDLTAVCWYVAPGILVSTVPLPWLPESSRRGVVTLGGAK
jgi:hypothetical protein